MDAWRWMCMSLQHFLCPLFFQAISFQDLEEVDGDLAGQGFVARIDEESPRSAMNVTWWARRFECVRAIGETMMSQSVLFSLEDAVPAHRLYFLLDNPFPSIYSTTNRALRSRRLRSMRCAFFPESSALFDFCRCHTTMPCVPKMLGVHRWCLPVLFSTGVILFVCYSLISSASTYPIVHRSCLHFHRL
jgi:hypothetical protein